MKSFGDDLQYYSRQEEGHKKSSESSFLEGLLADDTKLNVELAYKQWNITVRNYMRSETGLKLSMGDDLQTVPIRIIDGLPDPFANLIDLNDAERMLWELMLNRPLFEQTKAGLEFSQRKFSDIAYFISHSNADKVHIDKSLVIMEQLLLILTKENRIIDEIKHIQEDILGAYFFKKPEIHLYWMVIGFVAGILDVSVEDLALVTLIHEISHAYSHLGKDIDGKQWKTKDFSKCDIFIVEGLAQYYTEIICGKISLKKPSVITAFHKLLDLQSGPYTAYKRWFNHQEFEQVRFQEVVRFSLIDCRTNRKKEYEAFLATLHEISRRIGIETEEFDLFPSQ